MQLNSLGLILAAIVQLARSRSPADVANPRKSPLECHRPVEHSSLCTYLLPMTLIPLLTASGDPDGLLSEEAANLVEGRLGEIEHAEVAALIVLRMDTNFVAQRSKEAAAENFARAVHDAWGVGDAEKQNGVLVFLSVEDGLVALSIGDGIPGIMASKNVKRGIILSERSLRHRSYKDALEFAIQAVHSSVKPSKISKRTQLTLVFLAFITLLVLLPNNHQHEGDAMRKGLQLLREFDHEIEGIIRAVYIHNEIVPTAYCPICQQDFAPADKSEDSYEDSPLILMKPPSYRTVALPCGHIICYPCMKLYKDKRYSLCPMCKLDISALFPCDVYGADCCDSNSGYPYLVLLERVCTMHHVCPYVISLMDQTTMGDCVSHGDLKRLMRYTRRRIKQTEENFANFYFVLCFRHAMISFFVAIISMSVVENAL